MAAPILTAERLRDLFHYDQNTGIFTRKISWVKSKIGQQVGTLHSKGYVSIRIGGRKDSKHYFAHRLAWLHLHGAWPVGQIDHINGNRSDNRICNLRDVTQSENMLNQHRAQRDNRHGHMGVTESKGAFKYKSGMTFQGRRLSFGYYQSPEDAHAVYARAKKILCSPDCADLIIGLIASEDLAPNDRGRIVNLLHRIKKDGSSNIAITATAGACAPSQTPGDYGQ